MAFSTSVSMSLFLVATVCCLIVTTAGVKLPLPHSVADLQSKQIYVAPTQFYNYYNPYEYQGQVLIQTEQKEVNPELASSGRQNLPLSARPAASECILDKAADTGLKGCTLGSQAASGNIDLKFTAAKQGVIIALVPPSNYSKVKITCSEITTGVKAFTKTAKISLTTDTPVTETKQTQVFVVSAAANNVFKCSWEASA
uniref:Uncharacterized protein n=1 Tax=Daphnia galeata TaxID=27404 RepID=A0A8J2S4D7_9CRUS|nr:unnamed protein product [Daphnia galeata]